MVAPNYVSYNKFLDWINNNNNNINNNKSLVLVILGVMGGEGYKKLIEIFVMKSIWMNGPHVLIKFLLKILLITPLFLLVFLLVTVYIRLVLFDSLICDFMISRV